MPDKDEIRKAYEKGYKDCLQRFIDVYLHQALEVEKLMKESLELVGIEEENHARS